MCYVSGRSTPNFYSVVVYISVYLAYLFVIIRNIAQSFLCIVACIYVFSGYVAFKNINCIFNAVICVF